jgi:DNA-directed RNA polymerase specialized sigma24 family protein
MISRRPRNQPLPRGVEQASDSELMTRVAGGDSGALGELYDRYQAPVRRFLTRATADAEDVDDLLHGTFMAAASSAGRYDGWWGSRCS